MVRQELNPKIFDFLKKKLENRIAESTIRPSITRIRAKNPTLTLNAAAEIFARKYGTSVQRYWSPEDRASYGTIIRDENGLSLRPIAKNGHQKTKIIKPKSKERVIMRSAVMGTEEERWDAFISHASEDKDAIARPLHDALTREGIRVWYDETTLKIGDRLHKSIDKGILNSGFGIVILSKNFFAKDWPQRELEALVAKEVGGQKVILPVWHNVDAAFIRSKSLLLAGIVGVSTDQGVENVAKKLLEVIKPSTGQVIAHAEVKIDVNSKDSIKSVLQGTISSLKEIDEQAIAQTIKDMEFGVLKQTYLDILEALALLDIPCSPEYKNVFVFLNEAILGRNRNESVQLFETLLKWYFETAAPKCRIAILQIISRLTRSPSLKEIAVRDNRTGKFVGEFGRSERYEIAGINTEILQNIKSYLSANECTRLVDFAYANDQIYGSTVAKQYLLKMLPDFEDKVDRKKIERLYDRIS